MQVRSAALLFAALSVAAAHSPAAKQATLAATSAHASKAGYEPKLSPPLSPKSDGHFYGPPFPADYPDDKRPVPDRSILDKVKSKGQPYPVLQSKADFDKDYVKDENSDKGAWKAQFEYDNLRRKLQKEAGGADAAGRAADKEAEDVERARAAAKKASEDAEKAKKDVDDAVKGEDDAKKGGDDGAGGAPSEEELEAMKKKVKEAEEAYEKEKADFEKCEAELAKAKKNLEELKAKQAEMEAKLAADTKLWLETKTARLNLQKTKEEAAHSKVAAAAQVLQSAQSNKDEMDKILAEKKAKHDAALKNLQSHKDAVAQAKKDLDKATITLQKLRGYKPAEAPAKSGAASATALLVGVVLGARFF